MRLLATKQKRPMLAVLHNDMPAMPHGAKHDLMSSSMILFTSLFFRVIFSCSPWSWLQRSTLTITRTFTPALSATLLHTAPAHQGSKPPTMYRLSPSFFPSFMNNVNHQARPTPSGVPFHRSSGTSHAWAAARRGSRRPSGSRSRTTRLPDSSSGPTSRLPSRRWPPLGTACPVQRSRPPLSPSSPAGRGQTLRPPRPTRPQS